MYIKIPKKAKVSDFKYTIEDTNLVFHSNTFVKLKKYDTAHISQAQLIKNVIDTTTMPFVFCADLNSIPSSYVYHTISKNLNDAFLQNSIGWQKTYVGLIPFLRIDVVLMNKKLDAITYTSPRLNISDHYPIITDLVFTK